MNGKKRTRLTPEGRRKQLLDSARDLIQDQGFSGFTMEALATEAG
ncbi:MAG: TetR family transcriptional regulator, partial [Gammaproteobacteria bacterium]|nr:TetR family transcriptional regulator [Gammaproteobacteria bacterium]